MRPVAEACGATARAGTLERALGLEYLTTGWNLVAGGRLAARRGRASGPTAR